MSGRRPFVAGNWKMHKTPSETGGFVRELAARLPQAVDAAVCVPFTSLAPAVEAARGSALAVYAQNMHEQPQGAFTGEVSAAMLVDGSTSTRPTTRSPPRWMRRLRPAWT